jgi:hypothetical protein
MEDTHRTALAHLWLAVEAELPLGSIEPEATFDYLFDRLITIALVKRVDPAYMAEAMSADSDEAAPLFRDDCAPGFRDDLAPLRLGSCWSRLFSVYRGWESRFTRLISPQAIA